MVVILIESFEGFHLGPHRAKMNLKPCAFFQQASKQLFKAAEDLVQDSELHDSGNQKILSEIVE